MPEDSKPYPKHTIIVNMDPAEIRLAMLALMAVSNTLGAAQCMHAGDDPSEYQEAAKGMVLLIGQLADGDTLTAVIEKHMSMLGVATHTPTLPSTVTRPSTEGEASQVVSLALVIMLGLQQVEHAQDALHERAYKADAAAAQVLYGMLPMYSVIYSQ